MVTMGQHRQEESKNPLRLPYRKYGYFRDDQIIVLVTHKNDVIPEEILSSNHDFLNQAVKSKKTDAFVDPEPRVDTIRRLPKNVEQGAQPRTISMLTYQVEEAPENPSYLLDAIAVYNKILEERLHPYQKGDERSIGSPDSDQDNNQQEETSDFQIIGASPNWLTSIASQGAGTGGPGGRPSPYHGSSKDAPAGFGDLITNLNNKKICGDGSGIDIAILDTAPSAHALVAAPKEWPDHPAIKTLLGPEGKLHLYPAPYDETLRLGNTSLNDHDYIMTDHGLFIAGIIHSIAPKAEIHLIEVLNQYGVGDLSSFVRGLEVALNDLYNPERKLVINCSWMLEFPRDQFHCRHSNVMDPNPDPDAEFERQVFLFAQEDNVTAALLELLFDQFSDLS